MAVNSPDTLTRSTWVTAKIKHIQICIHAKICTLDPSHSRLQLSIYVALRNLRALLFPKSRFSDTQDCSQPLQAAYAPSSKLPAIKSLVGKEIILLESQTPCDCAPEAILVERWRSAALLQTLPVISEKHKRKRMGEIIQQLLEDRGEESEVHSSPPPKASQLCRSSSKKRSDAFSIGSTCEIKC